MTDDNNTQRTAWEKDILAEHRGGPCGDKALQECSRLRKLRDTIEPFDEKTKKILEQIIALEIWNWNFEKSILALCRAIGSKRPAILAIGHQTSVFEERWRKVCAYYLALRNWLCRIWRNT